MGGLADTAEWGSVWAVFAVVAGVGLAVAAATLFRREAPEPNWFAGYDAMAGVVDR